MTGDKEEQYDKLAGEAVRIQQQMDEIEGRLVVYGLSHPTGKPGKLGTIIFWRLKKRL